LFDNLDSPKPLASAAAGSEPSGAEKKKRKPMDHALRISFYQAQFKHVFPSLTVDLLDSCAECGKPMTDIDIRAGWSQKDNDYTTACPSCHERFVARFTVRPLDAPTIPAAPTPNRHNLSPLIDMDGDEVDHQVALEKRRKAERATEQQPTATTEANANIVVSLNGCNKRGCINIMTRHSFMFVVPPLCLSV
jgi:5-methylcytosine-specific restriction endonuclease McrA